jgi:hypothetical protein
LKIDIALLGARASRLISKHGNAPDVMTDIAINGLVQPRSEDLINMTQKRMYILLPVSIFYNIE